MRTTLSWRDSNFVFAVDRRVVVATMDAPELVPVPFAPSWLRGVANRYGRAVAVVDCGQLAGLVDQLAPVQQVLVVPAAGAELGLALAEGAVERVVGRGGDIRGFFDCVEDAQATRIVVVERLVQAIAEWLGGTPGS